MTQPTNPHLSAGNFLFVDGKFEEALAQYNAAVAADSNLADNFTKRSAAHKALQQYEQALEDANAAIRLGGGRDYVPQLHKAESCFWLDEFETAKRAFQAAATLLEGANTAGGRRVAADVARWMRKCDAEIAEDSASSDEESAPAPAPASAPAPVVKKLPPQPKRARHEFYQTPTHVVLSIFAKNVEQSSVEADFQRAGFQIEFPLPGGSSFSMDIETFGQINPSECTFRTCKPKVEVKLRKAHALHWPSLEGKGVAGGAAPASAPAAAAAPKGAPTPYASKKNWAEVEKAIDAELEAEKP
jgi:suppressor of G2 allele of SKP1